jgi:hypothetical protein
MLLEGIPYTQRSLSGKPSQVVLKCNSSGIGKNIRGLSPSSFEPPKSHSSFFGTFSLDVGDTLILRQAKTIYNKQHGHPTAKSPLCNNDAVCPVK